MNQAEIKRKNKTQKGTRLWTGGLEVHFQTSQIDTVVPMARYRCGISSETVV